MPRRSLRQLNLSPLSFTHPVPAPTEHTALMDRTFPDVDRDLLSLSLPLGRASRGKVRDMWTVGDERILVTTDRQSAFDVVLGTIPYKGQVLTQLTKWWFDETADIIPNHVVSMPDPNVIIAKNAKVWPVEMVIRGYITGVTKTALWFNYAAGERTIYGIEFPEGLQKNERLPKAVITPTTKAAAGEHDERLTRDEILNQEIVPREVYEQMEAATLALFARGQEIAAKRGLILVDTKYEFGDVDGQLTLIDEIHTTDSSRWWLEEDYEERFRGGREPKTFDKEFLRRWYIDKGYQGDGAPPPMPRELAERMAESYIEAYEKITYTRFREDKESPAERIPRRLREAGYIE